MYKYSILIVDDDPTVLTSISKTLREKYQVRAAKSGQRALEIAAERPQPDIILLDIMMPDLDGFVVLAALKNNPLTKHIPVIFVTGKRSEADEEKGLQMGAVDYITKPVSAVILLARVRTQLLIRQANTYLQDKNEFLEEEVSRRMRENQAIQDVSIRALAHLAETRDPETGYHILRTQAYVNQLATLASQHAKFCTLINSRYIDLLTKSAPLHDIGKVGIPDHVLLKPGSLNDTEWEIMKTHAQLGAQAIELAEQDIASPVPFFRLAKEVAHWHHERWDGSGYPDGLCEEAIPLSARIMALADVFDALISPRIYKQAFTFEQAKLLIGEQRAKHFDPALTDIFLQNFDLFVDIASGHLLDEIGKVT